MMPCIYRQSSQSLDELNSTFHTHKMLIIHTDTAQHRNQAVEHDRSQPHMWEEEGVKKKNEKEKHRQGNRSAVHSKMPSPAAWFKNSTQQHLHTHTHTPTHAPPVCTHSHIPRVFPLTPTTTNSRPPLTGGRLYKGWSC